MDQPDLDALEQDVESARVRLAEDITRWRDPTAMAEFKDTVEWMVRRGFLDRAPAYEEIVRSG